MKLVTVAKKGSQPRHNIEFQPFNKYCKWEVHHTPWPFEIVSNIPKKCYKTALNAYNRYHQVPLHKNSTKLNIFITSFGKYLFLRAPQGHMTSGGTYSRCYDDIPTGL